MFGFSLGQNEDEESVGTPKWLFTLFFLGFVLVLVGIAFVAIASLAGGGTADISILIFVGPIPIVFGEGSGAIWLVFLGIILTSLSIIALVLTRRKTLKNES